VRHPSWGDQRGNSIRPQIALVDHRGGGDVQKSAADPIVFVIDDDVDVREGLQALFESVGLRCDAFGSATQFLTRRMSDEVSCLVLDVRLPGLSGLDVQSALAEAQISIPIVFITGHGDIPMTVKAMKGGAVEFLTKPIREQDLLDAVRTAFQHDRIRRQREDEERDLRSRFDALSAREREIVALVTAGLMNKQIAAEIGVSEVTVKVHRHNAMQKLGARSLADLVRIADLLSVTAKNHGALKPNRPGENPIRAID
jgi:RNA polymerase sigma factor (sigma-70 family)